jgi:hypothetical protein
VSVGFTDIGRMHGLQYGVGKSEQIYHGMTSTGKRKLLVDAGAEKFRIRHFQYGDFYSFAAVKIDKEMGEFRKFWLSLTHTKINLNGQYYFFNNNSVKKRLGNKAFSEIKKIQNNLKFLIPVMIEPLFNKAKDQLLKDHKIK